MATEPAGPVLSRKGDVPPLLAFLLPSSLGQGWAEGLADGAPLHRGCITLTLPVTFGCLVSLITGRWWLSPSPVFPPAAMAMLHVALGWFGAAESSRETGPCFPCVSPPALDAFYSYR